MGAKLTKTHFFRPFFDDFAYWYLLYWQH